MGETKFQRDMFTVMMCIGMVLGMSAYNIGLHTGFNAQLPMIVAKEFLGVFVIAFALDYLLVGPAVKKVVFAKIDPAKEHLKFVLTISISMTICMVLLMSVYSIIHQAGFSREAFPLYPKAVLTNMVMALPLNLLVVSPIVRLLFMKIFHVSIEEDDQLILEEEAR